MFAFHTLFIILLGEDVTYIFVLNAAVTKYEEAAPFPGFPGQKSFLAVYIRDVWSRLSELRAAVTSVFGSILKVDSTKKGLPCSIEHEHTHVHIHLHMHVHVHSNP